jgi:hypothetical protein
VIDIMGNTPHQASRREGKAYDRHTYVRLPLRPVPRRWVGSRAYWGRVTEGDAIASGNVTLSIAPSIHGWKW